MVIQRMELEVTQTSSRVIKNGLNASIRKRGHILTKLCPGLSQSNFEHVLRAATSLLGLM